ASGERGEGEDERKRSRVGGKDRGSIGTEGPAADGESQLLPSGNPERAGIKDQQRYSAVQNPCIGLQLGPQGRRRPALEVAEVVEHHPPAPETGAEGVLPDQIGEGILELGTTESHVIDLDGATFEERSEPFLHRIPSDDQCHRKGEGNEKNRQPQEDQRLSPPASEGP